MSYLSAQLQQSKFEEPFWLPAKCSSSLNVLKEFINNLFQKVLLKILSCFILFYFSLNSSPILSCSLSFYTGRSVCDLSLFLCADDGIRYSDSNSDLLTFGIVRDQNPLPPQGKKLVFFPVMWVCQGQCKDKHSSTHNLVPRVSLEWDRPWEQGCSTQTSQLLPLGDCNECLY